MSTQINPWEEVSPGRWERSTTGYERFFFYAALKSRAQGQPEDYFLLSQIRISPTPSEQEVNAAWKSLRSLQPALATEWETDGKVYKKTYREGDDQAKADETLLTFHKGTFAEHHPSIASQTTAKLLFFPENGELVLRAPHWAIDARGSLHFWDGFLSQLSAPNPPDGHESDRLPLSHGDSLGCIAPKDITQEQNAKVMAQLMDFVGGGGPSPVHPPSTIGIDKPARAIFADARLTEEQTKQLIQGCKRRGYSVTSAVHAAIVLANIAISDSKDGCSALRSMGVFDVRKYLLPGMADKYPVSLYATPIPYSLPLDSPVTETKFEDIARFFGQFYKTALASNDNQQLVNHWFDILDAALTLPEAAAAPPQQDPFTSSIGIIDDYIKPSYNQWQVNDFHFVSDSTDTSTCIYWYTFRGTLRLVYAYNEALFKEEVVSRFLQIVKDRIIIEFCHN